MSDDRIYDVSFSRTFAREKGKIKKGPRKSTRFELFGAYQFSQRLDGRNFSKRIPGLKRDRKEFYKTMFRLRINGKWYKPGGQRYSFLSQDEIAQLLLSYGEQVTL